MIIADDWDVKQQTKQFSATSGRFPWSNQQAEYKVFRRGRKGSATSWERYKDQQEKL